MGFSDRLLKFWREEVAELPPAPAVIRLDPAERMSRKNADLWNEACECLGRQPTASEWTAWKNRSRGFGCDGPEAS